MKLELAQSHLRENHIKEMVQLVEGATKGLWLTKAENGAYTIKCGDGQVIATVYSEEDVKLIARSKFYVAKLLKEVEEMRNGYEKYSERIDTTSIEGCQQMSWDELLGGITDDE